VGEQSQRPVKRHEQGQWHSRGPAHFPVISASEEQTETCM